jgi:quinol monooxygenase YgiN
MWRSFALRRAHQRCRGDVSRARHFVPARSPGNLRYDVYRSIDDDQEFYVVEQWASPKALAAHGRTEAFIRYGQGVLVKYATLHDTVTARPFEVA